MLFRSFSYGTILGNYFASLFPGRVGRLVLDGVSNADDYATGAVSLFLHLFPSYGRKHLILHSRPTNLYHHRAGQPTWSTTTEFTTNFSKGVSKPATSSAPSSDKATQTPTTPKQESGNGSTTWTRILCPR